MVDAQEAIGTQLGLCPVQELLGFAELERVVVGDEHGGR
jgi:hypothetical protein